MPVVDYKKYCAMLDNAKKNKFAYAAINVTSEATANAVLSAFAEMKCDGIIQVSTGGGEFASGQSIKDAALGAISIAQHVHLVAERYDINVALHTDHCPQKKIEPFLKPLIEESRKRVKAGLKPLFNSHMFDGSELPLKENMDVAVELLKQCAELGIILEVEAGVVGGEEDGVIALNTSSIKLSELDLGIGPFVVGPAIERKIGKGAFSALSIDTAWRNSEWAKVHGLFSDTAESAEELEVKVSELSLKLSKTSPEAVARLKSVLWENTEDWEDLLMKRAELSGRLILSEFSKNYISAFREQTSK